VTSTYSRKVEDLVHLLRGNELTFQVGPTTNDEHRLLTIGPLTDEQEALVREAFGDYFDPG